MSTTEPTAIKVELDDNVLDRLTGIICGDANSPQYRSGYQLRKFFEAAGWRRVSEPEGSRYQWVQELLRGKRRNSEALTGVLLRLADPREYLDDESARVHVVNELNKLLAVEGYEVIYVNGRPRLVIQAPTLTRALSKEPLRLTSDLSEVVSNQDFGRQLESRANEARICLENNANTAAVIMLGSLLEGVLFDVASHQHDQGPKPKDHLESLINLAKDKGWLPLDIVQYAHVLRGHRNLVHPRRQDTDGYAPNHSSALLAWNVVMAILNDLAPLKQRVQRPDVPA